MKIFFFVALFFLNTSFILACNDSLIVKTNKNGATKLVLYVIKGWQKISYNNPLINCQFKPSCSNYAISAIQKEGIILGILYSADRISRCNPFAYKYYPRENGKLIDEFISCAYYKSNNIPYIAFPLSFFIPGFNKMINGRFYDGITLFVLTGLSGYSTYQLYENKNILTFPIAFISVSFYLSDLYFNILSIRKEK